MNRKDPSDLKRWKWSIPVNKVVFRNGNRDQFEKTIELILCSDPNLRKAEGKIFFSWVPTLLMPTEEYAKFNVMLKATVRVSVEGNPKWQEAWIAPVEDSKRALEAVLDLFQPVLVMETTEFLWQAPSVHHLLTKKEMPHVTSHMVTIGMKLVEEIKRRNYSLPYDFLV